MTLAAQAVARIGRLRAAMKEAGLDAYVVLSADPHLSEYLPDRWAFREWLSGFGGSAGTLVVTASFAGLWTDSRYWVQAQGDLDGTGIALMRAGHPDVPGVSAWLAQNLQRGQTVGVDGHTLALATHAQWLQAFEAPGLALDTRHDLADAIWRDRPPAPRAPVAEHLPPHACRARRDNLAEVRQAMAGHGADWHWLSALDDIAWLLNLRGSDVDYNPVFLAHLLLGRDEARLFIAQGKLDAGLSGRLAQDGVVVCDYTDAGAALAALPRPSTLLVDPARVTHGALEAGEGLTRVEAINPSQLLKSRKTEQELQNVRQAMEQDGAALCEFFAWFEQAQPAGGMTELAVDEYLTAARARRPGFVCPSFGTIAAFNANAAMPHYHATQAAHATIEGDGLLLIDSGGQYLGGTTDITRMVAVGHPTDEQRKDCAAVLKGMIALSRLVFPEGISAGALDAVARAPIWATGADYGHGTGHGVGYFMNVHEGPQSISHRSANLPNTAMRAGMITSNEPGLYRDGKWGVRIENLVAARIERETEFGQFLAFETLTLCPIDTRCIETSLLTDAERAWLNAYHAEVRKRLEPLLEGNALRWLSERTAPIR